MRASPAAISRACVELNRRLSCTWVPGDYDKYSTVQKRADAIQREMDGQIAPGASLDVDKDIVLQRIAITFIVHAASIAVLFGTLQYVLQGTPGTLLGRLAVVAAVVVWVGVVNLVLLANAPSRLWRIMEALQHDPR